MERYKNLTEERNGKKVLTSQYDVNGENLMVTDADYYSMESDKDDGLRSDKVFFEQK